MTVTETISKTIGASSGRVKKSRIIAEALALDYEIATGTKAVVMLGGTRRRSRSGAEPVPGYFIRTTVFSYSWDKFARKSDAEDYKKLMLRSVRGRVEGVVKEHQLDMGILETMKFLETRFDSPLKHTLEKFRILSTSESFGL